MEVCCDPLRLLRAPGYRDRYEKYEPPEDLVQLFRSIEQPVTLLLVYGTWCNDSARIVPEVVKLMEMADNDSVWLLAVHVAYSETNHGPFQAGSVEVSRYPTIALLRGHFRSATSIPEGVEIARFVERSLEAGPISTGLVGAAGTV
ncbi:MAG: thioredoxin family protein [Armatimonadetes bacterium]|nr:thioredoxin family protein [Armatimonadota bacterium]